MRPREVWEKPQNGGDGKRKRASSSKKQQTDSGSDQPANDTTGTANSYTNASSPAYEGGQTDTLEAEPQLPVMKHRRASSAQLTSPQGKRTTMSDASALAALERAIKSSPHKFVGTQQVPIELGDLTPQPTRRILFPSPTQSQEARSKRISRAGSEKGDSRTKTVEDTTSRVPDSANKENCPPASEGVELDQLFEEDPFISARSTTPTPTSSGRAMVFKTPLRTPGRLPPTTGDFFSSAAKALLRPTTTPKRTPNKHTEPLGEMSPFTAHLNHLLSEANNGSPGSQSFDFPSLPSLHNTPGRHIRSMDFDFSQFDSQDLLSTDVPMPSSPPAWFGVYEDPVEQGDDSMWVDFQFPKAASSPDEQLRDRRELKSPGIVTNENRRLSAEFEALP